MLDEALCVASLIGRKITKYYRNNVYRALIFCSIKANLVDVARELFLALLAELRCGIPFVAAREDCIEAVTCCIGYFYSPRYAAVAACSCTLAAVLAHRGCSEVVFVVPHAPSFGMDAAIHVAMNIYGLSVGSPWTAQIDFLYPGIGGEVTV